MKATTLATTKIAEGFAKVTGNKEKAMAPAVRDALESFCSQEPEFEQAVLDGGSFDACMKAVAKGVGNSISDLDAYRKAVQFYFPGAKIEFQMRIDLIGDAAKGDRPTEPAASTAGVVLRLEDFL